MCRSKSTLLADYPALACMVGLLHGGRAADLSSKVECHRLLATGTADQPGVGHRPQGADIMHADTLEGPTCLASKASTIV